MLDIMTLMESAGVATGFRGGNYADELPYVSLIEAAGQLPCVIVESQLDLIEQRTFTDRAAMVVHSRMDENALADYGVIMESAMDDLKSRVKKFFERILKFIRSIIAKIKLHIDNITKTNKELWTRNSGMLQSSGAYRGLTFEGYRFERGAKYLGGLDSSEKYVGSSNGIMELIEKSMSRLGCKGVTSPSAAAQLLATMVSDGEDTGESGQKMSEAIDVLRGVSKEERTHAIVCTLCGKEVPKDGWESMFRQQAWGDKTVLSFGDDMFNLTSLKDLMTSDKYLADVNGEYKKMEAAIVRFESELRSQLDTLEKSVLRERLETANLYTMATSYYNAYITIISDVFDVVSRLKNIKVTFYTEMYAQARRMFVMLAGHRKVAGSHPTAGQNEDADYAADDVLDFVF